MPQLTLSASLSALGVWLPLIGIGASLARGMGGGHWRIAAVASLLKTVAMPLAGVLTHPVAAAELEALLDAGHGAGASSV